MDVLQAARIPRATRELRPTLNEDLRPTVADLKPGDSRHVSVRSLMIGRAGNLTKVVYAVPKVIVAKLDAAPYRDDAMDLRVTRRGKWVGEIHVDEHGKAPDVDFVEKIGDQYQVLDRVKVRHHRVHRAANAVGNFVANSFENYPGLSITTTVGIIAAPIAVFVTPVALVAPAYLAFYSLLHWMVDQRN
jgi:hypothetical protein